MIILYICNLKDFISSDHFETFIEYSFISLLQINRNSSVFTYDIVYLLHITTKKINLCNMNNKIGIK